MTGPSKGQPCLRCSFCGGHQADRKRLVKGSSAAFICERCVENAFVMLAGEGVVSIPDLTPAPANDPPAAEAVG